LYVLYVYMNEPRSYKKISEKEFLKFELCVTGRWQAKNGSQLATGGRGGGWEEGEGGGVGAWGKEH
jgi:hypothetical protein